MGNSNRIINYTENLRPNLEDLPAAFRGTLVLLPRSAASAITLEEEDPGGFQGGRFHQPTASALSWQDEQNFATTPSNNLPTSIMAGTHVGKLRLCVLTGCQEAAERSFGSCRICAFVPTISASNTPAAILTRAHHRCIRAFFLPEPLLADTM